MNKTLPIVIGVLLVAAVGALVFWQSGDMPQASVQEQVSTSTPSQNEQPTGEVVGTVSTSFTTAQVATHNSASSCWTIIDGDVYDLTQWIAQHPGGQQAILQLCGKDGTATFRGQHGTAQRQADILVTFKVGTLTQ